MDTHADTCVLGENFVIMAYTGRVCDVAPYSSQYESIKDVPIVTGATAWTSRESGETLILIIHEAIWMGDSLTHTLVNPNQLRAYGTTVQDNPFLTHLTLTDPDDSVTIDMHMNGTNIGFTTRTPTQDELESCRHLQLNSEHEWNPELFRCPMFDAGHKIYTTSSLSTVPFETTDDSEVIAASGESLPSLIPSMKGCFPLLRQRPTRLRLLRLPGPVSRLPVRSSLSSGVLPLW